MTSDKSSQERLAQWLMTHNIDNVNPSGIVNSVWQAQEAYWSKKCEEMEEALDWIAEGSVYLEEDIDGGYSGVYAVYNHESKLIGSGNSPLAAIKEAMKSTN